MISWLILMALLHPATTLGAVSRDTDPFRLVDSCLASRVREQRIPGLAVGIVRGDHVVHVAGFGVADPSGRPVTPDTPFILGSISKSFTALAVMQLVEQGRIDLDAEVRRYINWFTLADDASRKITVRQLLNQTSGISVRTSEKYAASTDVSDDALTRRVRDLSAEHLDRPVGTDFEYSGTNYAVLGLLVQMVSGESYESYVRGHIFAPMGMRHSFTSEPEAREHGLASGYLYWFFHPRATQLPFNRGSLPQGYLISSAEDMSRYLVAQLNRGRIDDIQLVSPTSVDAMHRASVPTARPGTSYGMGWEIGPVAGIPAIWHEGSIFNYHANVVLLPSEHLGFVLLENIYSGPDERRLNQIAEDVARLLTGKSPQMPASIWGLKLAYGILALILIGQCWGMWSEMRRLRTRLAGSRTRGTRWGMVGRTLAIVLNASWGLLIVLWIPAAFGMSLMATVIRIPDFGFALLACALLAFATSALEVVVLVARLSAPGDAQVAVGEVHH